MSTKQFRFHPEEREDFREALAWYRSRSTGVSTEFRYKYPKMSVVSRRLLIVGRSIFTALAGLFSTDFLSQ